MFFMYYILIWSDVSQICYGLNGIYYFAWMGYYTALKYTFLYIFKPWVRVLPFCLINIFYNISLAIYCTRIFICTFYMYQIITINWDISKKLEKLSKIVSVKIIPLITLSERKLSEKVYPEAFFIVVICKRDSHVFPINWFLKSFEMSPVFVIKDSLEKHQYICLNVVKTSSCSCYES